MTLDWFVGKRQFLTIQGNTQTGFDSLTRLKNFGATLKQISSIIYATHLTVLILSHKETNILFWGIFVKTNVSLEC